MDIKEYIKASMATNKAISQIYEELETQQFTKEQIDTAFQQILTESQAVTNTPEPVQNFNPVQTQPVLPTKKFDLTKAFLTMGVILIIVAVIIVIATNWSFVGPLGRILFLFIPMIALFAIYFFIPKNENYREIGDASLLLSLLIFPLFMGTLMYQTGILPTIDATLFLSSALLSLPVYVITEYFLDKKLVGMFSIASILVIIYSFGAKLEWEFQTILWVTTLVSLMITGFGYWLSTIKSKSAEIYFTFGTLFSLFILPTSLLFTLNKTEPLPTESNALIVAVFGMAYMFIASAYYNLYIKSEDKMFYNIKRFIEEVAPIIIIFSFIFSGFENTFMMVIALILSLGIILASPKIGLKSILAVGSLGLIISLLNITSKMFANSIGWPIVVFIAGFASIGLGFLVRKMLKDRKEEVYEPYMGIGLSSELETSVAAIHGISGVRILTILLALLFIGPMLLWLFISLMFRSF